MIKKIRIAYFEIENKIICPSCTLKFAIDSEMPELFFLANKVKFIEKELICNNCKKNITGCENDVFEQIIKINNDKRIK